MRARPGGPSLILAFVAWTRDRVCRSCLSPLWGAYREAHAKPGNYPRYISSCFSFSSLPFPSLPPPSFCPPVLPLVARSSTRSATSPGSHGATCLFRWLLLCRCPLGNALRPQGRRVKPRRPLLAGRRNTPVMDRLPNIEYFGLAVYGLYCLN